ncbi:MAG: class I SAM-dependent methyltransferase [Planctomycetaceae bacterium]|nr:class I SAM-dependent methyltransferase [Planctomycetaceae bacterium]
MVQNPYTAARDLAETTHDRQGRNRVWWENLPMTYVEWDREDRLPQGPEDFAAVERAYLDLNPWIKEKFGFGAYRDRKMLTVGCGSGVEVCLFAKGGAVATAIDITDQAVRLTEANARAQGLSIDVRRMDAEKMDFPNASFDYVYSWGVLHHSQAPDAAFFEVARVLRPGGSGLLMVYHRHSLRYYGKGLYWLLAKGKLFRGHTLDSVQGYFTDGYYFYSGRKRCRLTLPSLS